VAKKECSWTVGLIIDEPEAAKTRYLDQLNGAFEPKPTAAVDSGNGIQVLLRLQEPIVLGETVNGKFPAEDQARSTTSRRAPR
jgi:hypothetical protein